jgi:hypothetical protein
MNVSFTPTRRAPFLPIILGFAAWNLVVVGPARAQSLEDLLAPGATINAGGFQFSNFLLLNQTALNGAPLPDPAQIMVTTQSSGTGSGLLYSFEPSPFTVSGTGAFANLAFQYDVSTLDGVSFIGSNFLGVDGTVTGDSSVYITNSFLGAQSSMILNEVFLDGTISPNQPTNTLALPYGMTTWMVTTNLTFQSNASDATATVPSFITTFGTVPEPPSILLMLIGTGVAWCAAVWRGQRLRGWPAGGSSIVPRAREKNSVS